MIPTMTQLLINVTPMAGVLRRLNNQSSVRCVSRHRSTSCGGRRGRRCQQMLGRNLSGEKPESIFIQRRDNCEAVIKLVCHISFHYPAEPGWKGSKTAPFLSRFHFLYDSEQNGGRQRKIKHCFSIHEPIVRISGSVQLQFRLWSGGTLT